jgi:hypothetical protein
MLGPPKPRRLDEPIAVSLEALVPRDNFYRHLETNLDLGFVREWVHDLYADRGRPSVDRRNAWRGLWPVLPSRGVTETRFRKLPAPEALRACLSDRISADAQDTQTARRP